MAGYDPSGNWITDDGRTLYPQYTENAGGFWFVNDDKAPGHLVRLPDRPAVTNTDPYYGPGGQYTTVDPLNPGVYWYRDAQNAYAPGTDISQTQGGGGALEKIDAQGNVVGTYYHTDASAAAEGGKGWNLNQVDPNTGGPTSEGYAQDEGGLFGLGPVWGSLLGVGLVMGAGLGVGLLAGGPAAIGIGAGTAAAAEGGTAAAGALGTGELGLEFLAGGAGAAGAGGAGAGTAAGIGGAGAAAAGAGSALGTGGAGAAGAAGAAGGLGALGTYAPLIGAGISAGTGLIGSGIAASAARNAAQTQADAANRSNDVLWQIYNQNRADLGPYREVGYRALQDLVPLTANPLTYGPYTAPGTLQAADYAFDPNAYTFDPNAYAFNGQQYAFTPPSGQQVLNDDPGYQFRVSEGMKALERSAAAKGTLISGGQFKAAQQYGQNLASQEYQNAYERARQRNEMGYQRGLTENQMGYERGLQGNQLSYERGLTGNQLGYQRALTQNETEAQRALAQYNTNFNTATTLRNMRYNELAGLAGTGQQAVNQSANLGAQTGQNVANNMQSAAAAQAAGTVGAANAYQSGLQNVGNAANSYLNYALLSNLYGSRR